ncbi:hypothetical protein RQP46_004275 [Phenoliferia psychrophenolica]
MDGTTLPDAAAPSAAPRRSLSFPPEILLLILSFASEITHLESYLDLSDRNVALAQLALVSRDFRAAAYSVLYGDLRLPWMADTVIKLHHSFNNNPNLLPLVRRLEACAVDEETWVDCERYRLPAEKRTKWLDQYCDWEGIQEGTRQWKRLHEDEWIEDGDAGQEFEDETEVFLEASFAERGRGAWSGERNPEGALELLDLVASAPALQDIAVRGFKIALDRADIADRAPLPLITSIHTDFESPFLVKTTLSSLLVSWAPNLRSLRGYTDSVINRSQSPLAPTAALLPPSLTHLHIEWLEPEDPLMETLIVALSCTSNALQGKLPTHGTQPA